MTLVTTFDLTPKESAYFAAYDQRAYVFVSGGYDSPKFSSSTRSSFDHQHGSDEKYFANWRAADPAADYSLWTNRRHVDHIQLYYDLSALGDNKDLALIFKFDALIESRLLIFGAAGLLDEQILVPGDDQFLFEVESVDVMYLWFIHAQKPPSTFGGTWYFKGISGAVV